MRMCHFGLYSLTISAFWICAQAGSAAEEDDTDDGNGHGLVHRMAKKTNAALEAFEAFEDHLHAWSLVLTVLLGLATHFIQTYQKYREEQRALKLARRLEQLRDFFGPLRAITYQSKVSFNVFVDMYVRLAKKEKHTNIVNELFDHLAQCEKNNDGKDPIACFWMQFIEECAIHNNQRVVDILDSKAHLYEGAYPHEFLEVMAHQEELKLTIVRWRVKDFSHQIIKNAYPDGLSDIIDTGLASVKKEIEALSGNRSSHEATKHEILQYRDPGSRDDGLAE